MVVVGTLAVRLLAALLRPPGTEGTSWAALVHWHKGSTADAATAESSYRFIAHEPGRPDVPVRYPSCRPIRVVVNARLAPQGGTALLDSALQELSEASGLRLVRVGVTDELPRLHRPAHDVLRYGFRPSPVLVAWTTPKQDSGLRGAVVGLGGSSAQEAADGELYYVSGTVSLDTPALQADLDDPDRGPMSVRAVMLHELAHVLGLAHVRDPAQIMTARRANRTTLGPGDRAGLRRLGDGPCLP